MSEVEKLLDGIANLLNSQNSDEIDGKIAIYEEEIKKLRIELQKEKVKNAQLGKKNNIQLENINQLKKEKLKKEKLEKLLSSTNQRVLVMLYTRNGKARAWIDSWLERFYSELTERELEVILKYSEGYKYDDIANEIKVSRQRVNQILFRGLEKFNRAQERYIKECFKKYIIECSDAGEDKPKEKDINEVKDLNKLKDIREIISRDNRLLGDSSLTVRARNALSRAGMDTWLDVVDHLLNYGSLKHIRNLGEKTYQEILSNLFNYEEEVLFKKGESND